MPWRRFELSSGRTSKFWQINRRGKATTVRFGRLGTNGQSRDKEYESAKAAQEAVEKLIVDKLKKGYTEAPSSAATSPAKKTTSLKKPAKTPLAKITRASEIPGKTTLTFTAMVAPSGGGGGGRSGRETRWTFTAMLSAWRVDDGPVVEEELLVFDPQISDITLSNRMNQFPAQGIVRFSAERKKLARSPHICVELVRFLGKARDAKLNKAKKRLNKPTFIDDRVFGKVEFDPELEVFTTSDDFAEGEIGIQFCTASIDEAKEIIKSVKPLWRSRKKWFKEYREILCEETFEQCSEWWSYGSEVPLTKRQFMELAGDPVGINFYLDDGQVSYTLGGWSDELFGDHGVDVRGTLEDGLERSVEMG